MAHATNHDRNTFRDDTPNPETPWRYTPAPGVGEQLATWRLHEFNRRLAVFDAEMPGWSTVWGQLVDAIATTTHAVAEVVIPLPGEQPMGLEGLKRLASQGVTFGPPDRFVHMADKRCHDNSIELATDHGWLIGTGFAGAIRDGVGHWRSHSWVIDPADGSVIETTQVHYHPATRYFGLTLTLAELIDVLYDTEST